MKKLTVQALFVLTLILLGIQVGPTESSANEYLVQVDTSVHQKFGLDYPATYKFSIPAGSSDLVAQYRYSDADGTPWNRITEKTGTDFFNGIDAVRFDYAGGFAYISVKFSRSSDSIYLRVVDAANEPVNITFDSIPRYYDGRTGVVTITLDDWTDWCNADFRTAVDYLVSYGLYFTAGIVTGQDPAWNTSPATWASIQQKIDLAGDYMELASHSWSHPRDATGYNVTGYEKEVIGSRDAIRNNLTFRTHPYVPVYLEPYGYSDATLVSWVTTGDYLLTRSAGSGFTNASNFIAWDATQNRYGRTELVFNSDKPDDVTSLNTANNLFDQAMTQGGIYHLFSHPWYPSGPGSLWKEGSYLVQHLNYIKGRIDLWYVPFGQLYLYHFLQEMRGNLSIQPVTSSINVTVSASPTSGGSVSGGGTYDSGSTVTVNATANPGYGFVNWTEGTSIVSTTASYTFNATASRTLVANFVRTFTITTSATLPNAIIRVPYSVTLATSGGLPPFAWSVTSGSLPAGLNLDAVTGTISGIPTKKMKSSFTIRVTDSANATAVKTFSLKVVLR